MDLRDKGYTLYKKGLKYKEIAEKLDVSVNTVKSWASRYWKAEQVATKSRNRKKKVATEKVATKKQAGPGAPKGNVNAVGNHGGAPPRNTNALKHGGWSAVMFGSWSEENRAAIEQCDKSVDVEDLLVQELQLLTARESFLMQRIAKYSEKPTHIQMVHTSKTSRSFSRVDGDAELEARDKERYIEAIDKKVERGERLPGTSVDTSTAVEASYLIVERLERLLTDVQRQKSKVIQQLAEVRRLNGSGANEVVDDWAAAIVGEADQE